MSGNLQRPLNCRLLPGGGGCRSAKTRPLPEVIHS